MAPLTYNNYYYSGHNSLLVNVAKPSIGVAAWSWSSVLNRRKSTRFESYIVGQPKVIWNRETMANNLITTNHLRHVESMATMPSGAGNIPHLNSIILGEALASEENDLVFPSDDFSRQAHVPSPQKVPPLLLLLYHFEF